MTDPTTGPDDLEPAQHDEPDGPVMGWSAAEFSETDYSDPDQVRVDTVLIADGGDDDEELVL
jgi:hypothetical protein